MKLVDIAYELCRDLSVNHLDTEYILRRTASEGFPFLSKVLPSFAAHILKSIEAGYYLPGFTAFSYGKKCTVQYSSSAKPGVLPTFLRGLLNQIFCEDSGLLLEANADSAAALKTLRQLCEYCYKVAVPYDKDALDNALDTFLEIDKALPEADQYSDVLRRDFETYFREFHSCTIDSLFKRYSPRPGPGTYSDPTSFPHKWYLRRYVYDTTKTRFSSWITQTTRKIFGFWCHGQGYDPVEYSELLFVPKDSRGPRTIVREPFELLRYQMAFNSFASDVLTKLSRGRVNFEDQSVNRALARESSISRKYCTLDLSSASDSVSYSIMKHVFSTSPLLPFILSSSRYVKLPNGELYKMKKLAGMGSGLTFPCMSLLIYLTSIRSVVNTFKVPYSYASEYIFVYGDDIICPVVWKDTILVGLNRVGLKVNTRKSFSRSHFRESCGGDYYCGYDVGPVRLKMPNAKLQVKKKGQELQWFSHDFFFLNLDRHCRELVKAGLHNLARYYYRIIEQRYGKLPFVEYKSDLIGRYNGNPVKIESETTGTGDFVVGPTDRPFTIGLVYGPKRQWVFSTLKTLPHHTTGLVKFIRAYLPTVVPVQAEVLENFDYGSALYRHLKGISDFNSTNPSTSSRVLAGVVPRKIRIRPHYLSMMRCVDANVD